MSHPNAGEIKWWHQRMDGWMFRVLPHFEHAESGYIMPGWHQRVGKKDVETLPQESEANLEKTKSSTQSSLH